MVTRRLYLEDAYAKEFTAEVVESTVEGGMARVVLSATAFYPGGGGQPCDTGILEGSGWRVFVERVYEEGDRIVHEGRVEGEPQGEARGVINWERRYRLMRMHTAAHILGYAVKKIFGPNVGFRSSALGVEQSHCDFNARISRADLPKLEEVINDIVARNLEVKILWLPRDSANAYLAKFNETLTELHEGLERIRVVEIAGVYAVPCGGTHVRRTGEVGRVKLLKRGSKGAGVTRVRFTVE